MPPGLGMKLFMDSMSAVLLGPVPERRNNSIPGINVPYFRDNFIPGINSVPKRRNSAIQGINLG